MLGDQGHHRSSLQPLFKDALVMRLRFRGHRTKAESAAHTCCTLLMAIDALIVPWSGKTSNRSLISSDILRMRPHLVCNAAK